MKHIYTTTVLLLLLTGFSCKLNLQKRHYTKGFYVGHSQNRPLNKVRKIDKPLPAAEKTECSAGSKNNTVSDHKKQSEPVLRKNVLPAETKKTIISVIRQKKLSISTVKTSFHLPQKNNAVAGGNPSTIANIFQYLVYAVVIYFTAVELLGPPPTIEVLVTHLIISLILLVIYLILRKKANG